MRDLSAPLVVAARRHCFSYRTTIVWTLLAIAGLTRTVGALRVIYPCYNGELTADGRCGCEPNYAGRMCERRMHCRGHRRHRNFTCLLCEDGWTGIFCDLADCSTHGRRSEVDKTTCNCDAPYSGRFCNELTRDNVYMYYNSKIKHYAAYGVFSLIPLCFVAFCCKRFEKRRRVPSQLLPPDQQV